MMRTLRFAKIGQYATGKRAAGHELEGLATRVPPARSIKGTPWPPAGVLAEVEAAPFLDDNGEYNDEYDDEYDDVDRAPVPLEVDDDAPAPPLYLEDLEIDVRTRTLMGTGARAVRAVAKAGLVEARVARREPRAAPGVPAPQVMPPVGAVAAPPRVIVSPPAPVEPPHLPPEPSSVQPAVILPPPRLRPAVAASPSGEPEPEPPQAPSLSARITLPAGSAEARLISAIVSAQDARPIAPAGAQAAVATLYVRGADRARGPHTPARPGHRVLGLALLAAAGAAVAAYFATTAFLGGGPLGL